MTELLTAAQMREIERAAIESGKVTGLELMERAGKGAVEAILAEWPELEEGERRAVVLCGPGNNGGDGFVVARLLAERGWEVEVFLYGDAEKLPPDARENYERWKEIGACGEFSEATLGRSCDLFVDAIFGTGLTRGLSGEFRIVSELAADCSEDFGGKVVALDMPTGLCSDSGRVLVVSERSGEPHIVFADLTVTFHSGKLGHYLNEGPVFSHRLAVVDIGLSTTESEPLYEHWPPEIVSSVVRPEKEIAPLVISKSRFWEHKYDHGHAFILSGGVGRGGAARMAARAALRVGAGLVTVGCPPAALIENAAQVNAIMLRKVKDANALSALLQDRRINALALGPGMGTGDREAELLRAALAPDLIRGPDKQGERGPGAGTWAAPVLDADALTLVAQHDDLRALVHENCVLTPHAGEFARLFPDIVEKLDATPTQGPAYSQVDATRDAAKRIGATVLLKGPATVIATPDGRAAINAAVYDRAAPWLATAGAGDVLTGIIAGLLARGFTPFDAACTGAWLHTEAALKFGPGMIAEDLPDLIPRVLAELGA